MALIAAASINIDWAMFTSFSVAIVLIGLFVIAPLWLLWVWARRAVRRVCGNDIDRNAPRVRTRIIRPHKPIETEIADALHQEFPNRKPAQFV